MSANRLAFVEGIERSDEDAEDEQVEAKQIETPVERQPVERENQQAGTERDKECDDGLQIFQYLSSFGSMPNQNHDLLLD